MQKDAHKRSILKALMYRGCSVVILGIVSWITTKDITQTSIIAVGYQAFSLCGYYANERIWERIKWGRKSTKQDNRY